MKTDKTKSECKSLKITSLRPHPAQEKLYGDTTSHAKDGGFAADLAERGYPMCEDIKLVFKPGSTPAQHGAIAKALALWLDWATKFDLIQRIELVVRGGPYLTRDEAIDVWRKLLPADVVEDLVVDGKSWDLTESDNSRHGTTDSQTAATSYSKPRSK